MFGLKVEFLNEQTLESELYTFVPTLSSLVLSYNKPEKEQKKKPDPMKSNVNQVLDFDGLEEIKADEIALDIDADGPPASVEVALQDSLPTAQ